MRMLHWMYDNTMIDHKSNVTLQRFSGVESIFKKIREGRLRFGVSKREVSPVGRGLIN